MTNINATASGYFSKLHLWQRGGIFLLPFRDVVRIFVGTGAGLVIFLLIFMPFGLSSSTLSDLLTVATTSAFINGAIGLGLYLLWMKYLSNQVDAQVNYLKVQIFYLTSLVMLMGVALFTLRVVMVGIPATWHNALQFQLFTFSTAAILVVAVSLVLSNRELKQQLHGHSRLLKQPDTKQKIITLNNIEGQQAFTFDFSQWQYVQVVGNYIELYLMQDNKPLTVLLRLSLKSFMAELVNQGSCEQCHRSYVVNITNISKITKSTQGTRIHFGDEFDPVPIARNRLKQFNNKAAKYIDASVIIL
jgi:DNA-binding LytR/AlgR family response regulator